MCLLYCLQDRETMKKEIAVSKEGMTLARSKFEPMEKENTNLRVEIKHLQEVSYQWVSHDSPNLIYCIVCYFQNVRQCNLPSSLSN